MGFQTPGGLGNPALYYTTQPISPGTLVSLTVWAPQNLLNTGETFVRAGITNAPIQDGGPLFELLAGYVTQDNAVTWTGILPLNSEDKIYLLMRGNLNPSFIVSDRRIPPGKSIFEVQTNV